VSINPELLKQARHFIGSQKLAFIAAGDPSLGGDPAAAGGAPPMDPAMAGGDPAMAGGDPAMAGGAPPADPAAAGGGDPMAALQPMIQAAVRDAMAGMGAGAGGTANGEPKIDINVEVMQMKKLLAKLCDAMGVQIPAAEMVATPEDLNQMAAGGPGAAAVTPDSGGGAMGAIPPVQPMKAAVDDWESGVAFAPPASYEFQDAHTTTRSTANLATAMLMRNRSMAGTS
jgi:hypothetical protein